MTYGEWIPVTERLPDVIGHYLVCDGTAIAWSFYNSDGRWCKTLGYYDDITHRMPLPPPPKN
jgi:hypothetical protein